MFFTLLLFTFVVSAAVSAGVVMLFNTSIAKILQRIVKDDISTAWHRYITFAGFVVGISEACGSMISSAISARRARMRKCSS